MEGQSIYNVKDPFGPEEDENQDAALLAPHVRQLIHEVTTGKKRFADADFVLRNQLRNAQLEEQQARRQLEEMMGTSFAGEVWKSITSNPQKHDEDERPLVKRLAHAFLEVQNCQRSLSQLQRQFGDDTRVIALSDRVLELETELSSLQQRLSEEIAFTQRLRSPRAWLAECKNQERETQLMAAKPGIAEEEFVAEAEYKRSVSGGPVSPIIHEVERHQAVLSSSSDGVWDMAANAAHRRGHRSLSEGIAHASDNSNTRQVAAANSNAVGSDGEVKEREGGGREGGRGGGRTGHDGGSGSGDSREDGSDAAFARSSSLSPSPVIHRSTTLPTRSLHRNEVVQGSSGGQALKAQLWRGSFAFARDCRDIWCRAVVVDIDEASNEAQVKFNGWSRQYDEWLPLTAEFLRIGVPGKFKVSRNPAFLSRGWGYSGAPDTVVFTVDKPVELLGVGVFGGSAGTFYANASLFEGNTGAGLPLATSPRIEFSAAKQELPFSSPVTLDAGKEYTVSVMTRGPQSLYGEGYKKTITASGVTFQFSHCRGPNNGSSASVGQIPELFCKAVQLPALRMPCLVLARYMARSVLHIPTRGDDKA